MSELHERPYCPILSADPSMQEDVRCLEERCALWHKQAEHCAILTIGLAAHRLAEELGQLRMPWK